jgi:hypothetical protein
MVKVYTQGRLQVDMNVYIFIHINIDIHKMYVMEAEKLKYTKRKGKANRM